VFPHAFPIVSFFLNFTLFGYVSTFMDICKWGWGGGGMAERSMTKYASILGRDTFRDLCCRAFHVPKILVMGQSNGFIFWKRKKKNCGHASAVVIEA
jgi:hypothetical protein